MTGKSVIRWINKLVSEGLINEDQARPVINATIALDDRPKKTPMTLDVWNAYRNAYYDRYGVCPLDGAGVRAKMVSFIRKVPQAEAPELIRYYLSRNDSFYMQTKHDFGPCLRDVQKLYTEMKTGDVTSRGQADRAERYQASVSEAKRYLQRKHGT